MSINEDDEFLFLDDDDDVVKPSPKEQGPSGGVQTPPSPTQTPRPTAPPPPVRPTAPTVMKPKPATIIPPKPTGGGSSTVSTPKPTESTESIRPKVDIGQEDVLEQGSTYKGDDTTVKSSTRERPVRERPKRERPEKVEREPREINKKAVVIGAGIFMVVVAIFMISAFFNRQYKQKQEEEEESRLNEIMNEETTEYYFSYTREEVEALRLAGYTGNEIEEFQLNYVSASEKIQEAEDARKAKYEEEIVPYFNASSDEFKELWNSTWIGQTEFTVEGNAAEYSSYNATLNLDYEKVGSYGYQCWLKVYLNEEDHFFIYVTPQRWNELAQKGNIVLQLYYTNIGEDQKSVITGWQEIIN